MGASVSSAAVAWCAFALASAVAAALTVRSAVLARTQRRREATFRAARQALEASEERLRFALDATTDVVWDWDVAADRIYHPSWAHAYGFPEERTPRTGAELGAFIHPDDIGQFTALLQDCIDGRRDALEFEHRALTGSGDWTWTLARARAVSRDANGRATRIVGTCADQTERRQFLGRLQMADRMASVGTLAAGVAHEMNNPLAYVIGNVSYALETLDGVRRALEEDRVAPATLAGIVDESAAALREAAIGADRVRGIVRDLKVFSRADDEERAPMDVRDAVRGALNLAGADIRRRARASVEADDVPAVLANGSKLSQVFVNLLVNAAQAIPEGRQDENEIRVAVREDPRGRVVVEVRDTGCGIAPEDQRRIFEPFYTTKPVGVGTGLGLAICHGIVTGLGGEIEVESAPGKGSTFRVSLPPAPRGTPLPADVRPPPRPAPLRGRVLVVDDEPFFCRAVERILGEEHEVVAIADPLEALRRVEAGERFDVVLTDVVMPRLSGIELLARMTRAVPDLADRTVFVTGGVSDAANAEYLAARPERVLEKPCAPAALRAAVAAVLERHARARAGAATA